MWLRGPFAGRSAVQAILQMKHIRHSIMAMSFTLLVFCAPFVSARPRHPSRRHSRGHNSRHQQKHFKMPALSKNGLPVPVSYHLVLSQTKPTQPPWELLKNNSNSKSGNDGPSRRSPGHDGHRSKRSAPFESVCPDIGEWVALRHSKDIYDYDVEVLQGISVGGVRMDQYFYETRCVNENIPCRGIDSRHFQSACQNKYIWTYGYVKNNSSEEGWRQIRIKGSCNCAIREHANTSGPSVSLLDFL